MFRLYYHTLPCPKTKEKQNYQRQKININTQNVKIARTDRSYSNEENPFRDFTLKTLNIDFYQYKCIYPNKWARYGLVQCLFSTGKMCKFSTTFYNRQLIQFARIPVEFVVHFIRYQNCMKVIINYTFHGCLVSAFNIFVQLMFTRSQSTMFRPVHRVHFITVSLG